jgi:hypothetical protein
MSVELYPSVEALDEKLATLTDPVLTERLVSENPALFPSAAETEEISVFAAAWKRFGNIALAVTAAASIAAGYVLTPPAVSHKERDLRAALRAQQHEIARLRARLAAEKAAAHRVAAPAPVAAPVAAPVRYVAPVPVPVHHAAPVHHTFAAPVHYSAVTHRVTPVAAPATQPQIDSAAAPESAPKSQVDTSVATAPAPTTDTQTPVNVPDGTKTPPQVPPTTGRHGGWGGHFPVGAGSVILGGPADPCTPQGGRVGTVLTSIAGQILGRAISRGF